MHRFKPLRRNGIALCLTITALVGISPFIQTSAAEQAASSATDAVQASDWLRQHGLEPQLLAQQQQPRTALVIGNADYGGEDSLEAPDDDAQAMYEKLRELGFDVPPPLINATKQEMEQALRDFAQRMEEGGINVFYYSGHGVQIDGVNYLMPIGLSTDSSQVDVQYNAVRLDYVVGQMFSTVHDFNFLIIDACRNNPFYSRWGRPKGPGNQGLTSTRPPTGTMIAYAAEENEVAIDGEDTGNSPFTTSLLNYLGRPGFSIYDLLHSVRRDVETTTEGDQIPSWEGSPRDIIALNPATTPTLQPSPPVQPAEPVTTPEPPIQPPVSPQPASGPTLISAATGVNYQPLQEALAAGDFELADQTTYNLMVRAANREEPGWLRAEDVQNFSCEDLNIIDQLWLNNSDGKFGFSVQQQIYQRLGGTQGEYDADVWRSLGDEVGWRQDDRWLLYSQLNFGLDAPVGHLPGLGGGGGFVGLVVEDFEYLDGLPSCGSL